MPLNLSDGQKKVLDTDGHLLITGGPGSGKTTVSILKAAKAIRNVLKNQQHVLFLSFARATVARVLEAIQEEHSVTKAERARVEVATYHSFFWQIIETHGYLLGLPRRLSILTPPSEAVALSAIRVGYPRRLTDEQTKRLAQDQREERWRLAREDGLVCFDLFAEMVTGLLSKSSKLRQLIAKRYPVIILDEFQDTNEGQWASVKSVGEFATLIALADPEQRIFDFIGADPERLTHFKEAFKPMVIDLSDDNHRSAGTEIALFGNDILTGKFRKNVYTGIAFGLFESNSNQAFAHLRGNIMQARTRLINGGKPGWSVAVLVPTKKLMRLVSDSLREAIGNMPAVPHTASIDMDSAILAAEVIAYLLQPSASLEGLVALVSSYFRGKNGVAPTKVALDEANRLQAAYDKAVGLGKNGKEPPKASIYNPFAETFAAAHAVVMTGDPDRDWQAVRAVLEAARCARLKEIGIEVRNIRLLDRGTVLRLGLTGDWRENGSYTNALSIVRRAFAQEHFASTQRLEAGVIVMNMHKAKGKQFDEVVIFEGWPRWVGKKIVANPDRIVRSNERTPDMSQARQNMRVSVTRARQRTTILTPDLDRCVLLVQDAN